jgi:CCR4-NOT transcription complex subunit 7/8
MLFFFLVRDAGNDPIVINDITIIDVWADNLEEQFKHLCQLVTVHGYRYVAMDTEFPGVVARPYGSFRSHTDYQYQTLKCNVDLLRIIQLGITFADETGKLADPCCWQFHFKFSLGEDMFAQDSIDLLTTAGINFEKHQVDGIDPMEFGAWLITSGLVMNDEVKWISFHSYYDFGYLIKLLTQEEIPAAESDFFDMLRVYFPVRTCVSVREDNPAAVCIILCMHFARHACTCMRTCHGHGARHACTHIHARLAMDI